jgi:hypothetical protein
MYAVVISVMVIAGSSFLEWSARYAVMVLLYMAVVHYELPLKSMRLHPSSS